jgi:hypothetical protein
MSYEPTEDDLRKVQEALVKALPAARAAIRKQLDAIEEAVRDGTLEEFAKQMQGKCAKCDEPPVLHVTDVSADTGEVTSFKLCEEHAREYRDKLPPGKNLPSM